MNPSAPLPSAPLLVRPPTILTTLPRSNPPPPPSWPSWPPADLAELMIPMTPLRSAGSRPLSSACCSSESPPEDWTMETTFWTLSSCLPDNAPSREPTSSLFPPSYNVCTVRVTFLGTVLSRQRKSFYSILGRKPIQSKLEPVVVHLLVVVHIFISRGY